MLFLEHRKIEAGLEFRLKPSLQRSQVRLEERSNVRYILQI